MAKVGRKPKPTHLKIIEGNPGKRPLNKNEPKPEPGVPSRPDWLTREAKREWGRVVPALDKLRLLTLVDRAALAMYCQEWGRYVEAQAQLSKKAVTTTPSGYEQPSPYVSIARSSQKACASFCAEFGLTPSSRGRMSLPEQPEDDDILD